MTFFRRLTAAAVAAVIFAGSAVSAFSEGNPNGTSVLVAEDGTQIIVADFGNETTIIDPDNSGAASGSSGGTEVIDPGNNTETTVVDAEDGVKNTDSVLDVSDKPYTEIDLTGWTKWDGKTKMESGTNYYIDSDTAPRSSFTIPAGSRFVIKSGAQLLIYKKKSLNVRGVLTIEPDAEMMFSGTTTVYGGAGMENYGSVKGSVSSLLRISGEYINRSTGIMTVSGTMNIYKEGILLNYGELTLTSNSQTKVTGDLQTTETGRLICRSYLAVTINGRTTQAGYFSLTGEVVNSGVFIFDRTVRYYKSKSARFAVSKSSRLIDYRYVDDSYTPPAVDTDTETEEAGEEATDIGIKGIDVSYAQGAIDWNAVKESGVEFAMLRASRGPVSSSRPSAEDTTFQYNVVEATKAGLYVGVYHYLYAETVADAKKEAQFFLKTIEPYKITYPVVLDVEEQSQANLGKKKLTKIVKAFLDEIKAAGYYGMLYSNKTWLTQYLDMPELSDYEVWLAQWNTVPTYTGDFGIWQYSSKGIVSGIDGYVDLNLSYKNYAKIIKNGGWNNL
ncbi:MAG: glycoside hydrolase family 25 protein [Oscillospiraceae bacterium]